MDYLNNLVNAWKWEVDPVATGRQLKKHRKAHDLTQEGLSEIVEKNCVKSMTREYCAMLEGGSKVPSIQILVFLSCLYNVPLTELVITYEHSQEIEERDQPGLLIDIITFMTNVCVCICSSFLFCKLAVL